MNTLKLPEKEGEYLFLCEGRFGNYYKVEKLLFNIDGDTYLEHGDIHAVTAWWHLPEPNKFC